ncbi:unnamed protein product [Vitrella brassicaformis CCMP3155]|uniref:Uncharacterized protein n=1 Tax=Vitrella brassicaformis (strain CCMP3155) TaxID=1169540 RepID=A0A0G4H6A5_VITBC|nr:unnamed protein product [Vitrella brassicaformis CCMP3155]|eukprot:CEM39236.1 unnamed protein product [Vitrella brassicaformis CCMP3155]
MTNTLWVGPAQLDRANGLNVSSQLQTQGRKESCLFGVVVFRLHQLHRDLERYFQLMKRQPSDERQQGEKVGDAQWVARRDRLRQKWQRGLQVRTLVLVECRCICGAGGAGDGVTVYVIVADSSSQAAGDLYEVDLQLTDDGATVANNVTKILEGVEVCEVAVGVEKGVARTQSGDVYQLVRVAALPTSILQSGEFGPLGFPRHRVGLHVPLRVSAEKIQNYIQHQIKAGCEKV